jgi:hypothetical protein
MKNDIAAYGTQDTKDNTLQIRIKVENLNIYDSIVLIDDNGFEMHIDLI